MNFDELGDLSDLEVLRGLDELVIDKCEPREVKEPTSPISAHSFPQKFRFFDNYLFFRLHQLPLRLFNGSPLLISFLFTFSPSSMKFSWGDRDLLWTSFTLLHKTGGWRTALAFRAAVLRVLGNTRPADHLLPVSLCAFLDICLLVTTIFSFVSL